MHYYMIFGSQKHDNNKTYRWLVTFSVHSQHEVFSNVQKCVVLHKQHFFFVLFSLTLTGLLDNAGYHSNEPKITNNNSSIYQCCQLSDFVAIFSYFLDPPSEKIREKRLATNLATFFGGQRRQIHGRKPF